MVWLDQPTRHVSNRKRTLHLGPLLHQHGEGSSKRQSNGLRFPTVVPARRLLPVKRFGRGGLQKHESIRRFAKDFARGAPQFYRSSVWTRVIALCCTASCHRTCVDDHVVVPRR
jgi:hypothetical protein